MSAEEKQFLIKEWDKHIEKNGRKHEIACFSSIREDTFRETFRAGILGFVKITAEEKRQLIAYTGL